MRDELRGIPLDRPDGSPQQIVEGDKWPTRTRSNSRIMSAVRCTMVLVLPAYDDLPTRRWWRVISPVGRRRLGALRADPLLLWTFQSKGAYRVLAETGFLRGDPTLSDADLRFVYPWMQRRADTLLTTSGAGLLWLWAVTDRRALVEQARHARGDVLLTVRMPRDHTLLSDFGDWHVALNSGIHVPPEPGEAGEAWWARAEPIVDDWNDRLKAAGLNHSGTSIDEWPQDLRNEAETSWEAILDPATWRPNAHIQAVAHAIRAKQVMSAVRVRPGPT